MLNGIVQWRLIHIISSIDVRSSFDKSLKNGRVISNYSKVHCSEAVFGLGFKINQVSLHDHVNDVHCVI